MNLPEQRAYARLFWEWVINQPDYLLPCYETHFVKGREIALCTHMHYNPDLGGTFEGVDCPLHKIIVGEYTDTDCLEDYKWLKAHCLRWDEIHNEFWHRIDEIHEGES